MLIEHKELILHMSPVRRGGAFELQSAFDC